MFAVFADAALHGISEIGQRPAAETGLFIRRDIRDMEGAEGAGQRQPARQHQLCIALRAGCGMTARAATGPKDHLTVPDIGITEICPMACRQGRWCGDDIKGAEADDGEADETEQPPDKSRNHASPLPFNPHHKILKSTPAAKPVWMSNLISGRCRPTASPS